ncbi:MAG: dihydropteroate synthase DHPS [Gaiellales bacterium]|nr:MAG: dihydropteroate synthase DHPS [Gaiellales bacterium]
MKAIAENINVMSKSIGAAMAERNAEPIQQLAQECTEAGADLLDINLGPARKGGPELMEWVVNAVQEASDLQLCLDTSNHEAMEAGIKACKKPPLLNSFSAQPDKLENILPLAARYDCEIIGLTMSTHIPLDADERIAVAYEIVAAANELGITNDRIWIDPIILPIGVEVGQAHAVAVQEVLRMLPEVFDPNVQTTCGLSNTSNGAPDELRGVIEQAFVPMLAACGMTSAIVNAKDKELMRTIRLIKDFKNEALYSVSDAELK